MALNPFNFHRNAINANIFVSDSAAAEYQRKEIMSSIDTIIQIIKVQQRIWQLKAAFQKLKET